jgi:mannose-6-phosphate isomerase-like protein (cupin superfamily)
MEKKEIIFNLEKDGEIFIFSGEPDCDAPILEFRSILAAGSKGPDPHAHPKQTETFHVISGTMIGRIKGQKEKIIGPGEKFVVPPGIVHSFSNGSKEEPLKTRITLEPALNFQWYISEAAKAGLRYGGSMNSLAALPEICHVAWNCRDEQRVSGMPYFAEFLLVGALALVARINGRYKKISPKPRSRKSWHSTV